MNKVQFAPEACSRSKIYCIGPLRSEFCIKLSLLRELEVSLLRLSHGENSWRKPFHWLLEREIRVWKNIHSASKLWTEAYSTHSSTSTQSLSTLLSPERSVATQSLLTSVSPICRVTTQHVSIHATTSSCGVTTQSPSTPVKRLNLPSPANSSRMFFS